jgi:hypothetical protein
MATYIPTIKTQNNEDNTFTITIATVEGLEDESKIY